MSIRGAANEGGLVCFGGAASRSCPSPGTYARLAAPQRAWVDALGQCALAIVVAGALAALYWILSAAR
jgi:hypothetical protein